MNTTENLGGGQNLERPKTADIWKIRNFEY